jgi:hypothetical protein
VTAEDGLNEKTKATKLMSVLKTVSVIAKNSKVPSGMWLEFGVARAPVT